MDDGNEDNFACAFPILRKDGALATVFVVTDSMGAKAHLSWDQVVLMHRNEVDFGSHTVHHFDLTTLAVPVLDHELRESRRALESRLGEGISAVAYPSGECNSTVVSRARAAGYVAG